MSTDNTCANCGKGEENSGDLKACTACKLVKYCNRDCQIAHRPQHKKACKKRAAELYDERLFNEPPPPEECPICMLPLPLGDHEAHFYSCCGKDICMGCVDTMRESGAKDLCPFCRTPGFTDDDDAIERVKKLMEKGNANAFVAFGGFYKNGIYGMPQNSTKATELYLKAGQLGSALAYYNLGIRYTTGDGVEVDEKKAKHYWELAAMNGHIKARHNLGCLEYNAGNDQRAMNHFLISVRAGYILSLDCVKQGYTEGHVTKEEYANTLREYQKSRDEMKSDARVTAAEALQINPPIN